MAFRKPEQKPDVFSYHNYRYFLRDIIAYFKAETPRFSQRQLARDLDLASGYLPMVISEKRSLSREVAVKLLPALGLNSVEISFFMALCDLADSPSPIIRQNAMDEIQKNKKYKKKNPKELEAYSYLGNWRNVAIREMLLLKDFQYSEKWISTRLTKKVTRQQVKLAIRFLKKNGFIEQDKNRKWKVTQKQVDCLDGIYRLSLGQFHQEMLKFAMDSINGVERDRRKLLGHTFAIEENSLAQVFDVIEKAKDKIRSISESSKNAESVYHVEFACFPIALGSGKDSKK